MITCKVCGYTTENQITWRHLASHNMTVKQYKDRFPGFSLMSDLCKQKIAKTVTKVWAGRSKKEKSRILKNLEESSRNLTEEQEKIRRQRISEYYKSRTTEQKIERSRKISDLVKSSMSNMTVEQKNKRKLLYEKTISSRTLEEQLSINKSISDGWKRQTLAQKDNIRINKSIAAAKAWARQTPAQINERGRKISNSWSNKTQEQRDRIRKKYAKSISASPNKAEQLVLRIVRPMGFRYVGDGTLNLVDKKGLMNPDFVRDYDNTILELYGDYFHTEEEWVERHKRLKELGYTPVMVWYSELMEDPSIVIKRIQESI